MKRERGRRPKKRLATFCADKTVEIDYKEVSRLRRFTTERGKILPRRITHLSAKDQRKVTLAIKRARAIALLPFSAE